MEVLVPVCGSVYGIFLHAFCALKDMTHGTICYMGITRSGRSLRSNRKVQECNTVSTGASRPKHYTSMIHH